MLFKEAALEFFYNIVLLRPSALKIYIFLQFTEQSVEYTLVTCSALIVNLTLTSVKNQLC